MTTAKHYRSKAEFIVTLSDAPQMANDTYGTLRDKPFAPTSIGISRVDDNVYVQVTGHLINANGKPGGRSGNCAFGRYSTQHPLTSMPGWLTAIVQPYLDAPVFSGPEVTR